VNRGPGLGASVGKWKKSNQTKSEAFWAFPLAAAENQNQTKLAKLP